MSKVFRPYEPRQGYLLPPSPLEWLPEGHLAYFLLDVVGELDLSSIYAHYEREVRGYPPHHPRMMVALLLYGYSIGVCSSRQIERRTQEDVAFRILSGGTHPDHSCISEFRRIHLKALSELFVQVLRLCRKAGLVKLGHVALDGTKVQANASKHKAMSYERMKEQEEQLSAKVRDLLQQAESADAQDDTTYGVGRRGDELPTELQRAQSRLQRIRQAKAELEAEAKQARESSGPLVDDKEEDNGGSGGSSGGGTELPSHRVPTRADATPTAKAQRNFTDPDSRIMKSGNGFVQGYNAQLVVDSEAQVIVAHGVGNQPPDAEYLAPMVERTITNCGRSPAKMSADAGYFSEANVTHASTRGVEPFIATGRSKHGERPACPRGRPPKGMSLKAQMARKLLTKRGRSVYARRKVIVEPVFGHIKEARGFRRFHLRSIGKVRGEWALVCIGHNLRKLHSAHLEGG